MGTERPDRAKSASEAQIEFLSFGRHPDGGGLYLRVTAGKDGALNRYWLFRYAHRGTGKDRQLGIGPLDTVSLAAARTAARECREQLLAGLDPIEEREAGKRKAATATAKSITFAKAAETYIASHEAGWAQWQAPATVDQHHQGLCQPRHWRPCGARYRHRLHHAGAAADMDDEA